MSAPEQPTLAELEARLATVRPVDREVFLAVRVEGVSYAEAGERVGRRVVDVERCIARVIAAMDRPCRPRRWWQLW